MRPVAAPDLKGETPCSRDALDQVERRRAGESAVEVDEVQPRRAFVAKAPRQLDRITSLDRHCLPAALGESHDAAFEDVDRRDQLEVLC